MDILHVKANFTANDFFIINNALCYNVSRSFHNQSKLNLMSVDEPNAFSAYHNDRYVFGCVNSISRRLRREE